MGDRIQAKFVQYHARNPQIWEAFRHFTFEAIKRKRPYFGARMVLERVRWYTNIEADGDPFKINNNYAPYYARLFMETYPQYKEIFRTRSLRD